MRCKSTQALQESLGSIAQGLITGTATQSRWRTNPIEEQTMKIVVIGGTGLIGSKLVYRLREMGHEAIAASPNTGVDTITGEGLRDVLTGAQSVVDVSNSPSFEEKAVMEFFTASTRNLLAAEKELGVGHHVALCIVGTDRLLESPYFRAKMAQENLIKESDVPFTILRSTQFFEFISRIATASADGKTVRATSAYIQPVVSDDVVSALAEIAGGTPANGTVEIAGPELFHMDALVRRLMRATGDTRQVITDANERYFGALLQERTLTSDAPDIVGTTHFADWVAYAVGHAQMPMARPTATVPSAR
jgi:uncharacterized protein YbjT (DUF2867 family)